MASGIQMRGVGGGWGASWPCSDVSYYEDSAQVLCSICQMQGEVSLGKVLNASPVLLGWPLYYSLSLKSLHLESFAFTSKMDMERCSETEEQEV